MRLWHRHCSRSPSRSCARHRSRSRRPWKRRRRRLGHRPGPWAALKVPETRGGTCLQEVSSEVWVHNAFSQEISQRHPEPAALSLFECFGGRGRGSRRVEAGSTTSLRACHETNQGAGFPGSFVLRRKSAEEDTTCLEVIRLIHACFGQWLAACIPVPT